MQPLQSTLSAFVRSPSMNPSTPFSAIVAARTCAGDTVTFDIAEDWQQGRTAYGGIVCAIAAQAMRDVAGADWQPDVYLRALQCSFVSVVAAGRVQIEVEVLRQGRNVCQAVSYTHLTLPTTPYV